jgi:hypothetical protein
MRKVILLLLAIAGLVIGGSSPALASAPTKITSGSTFFSSQSDSCGDFGTCFLYAAVDSNGNVEICFETAVFDSSGELVSLYEGCADNPTASAISFSGGGSVAATSVTLVDDSTGQPVGTFVVSAQDTPTGAKSYTTSNHSVFKGPDCMDHYSDKTVYTPVAGTISVQGVGDFSETGVIGVDRSHELAKGCDFTV